MTHPTPDAADEIDDPKEVLRRMSDGCSMLLAIWPTPHDEKTYWILDGDGVRTKVSDWAFSRIEKHLRHIGTDKVKRELMYVLRNDKPTRAALSAATKERPSS